MKNKRTFEHRIAGIPCLIEIDQCVRVPHHKGNIMNCHSHADYYGYYDIDYSVLDRKGTAFAWWLERKIDNDEHKRIEDRIIDFMEGEA